nr:unnamed protein product [Leishmania braziliensis]
MELNIALLVYAVLQFIAFFFVLVATPIDMFRSRGHIGEFPSCLTLWGFKRDCYSISADGTPSEIWAECPGRLMRFRIAEALAIVSIFVYGAAFALGVVMLFCCSCLRFVCVALNILGVATLCVVWAAMAQIYHQDEIETCPALQISMNYGGGFTLFVLAWVLDILNIFFLLLPSTTKVSDEGMSVENYSYGSSEGDWNDHKSQK